LERPYHGLRQFSNQGVECEIDVIYGNVEFDQDLSPFYARITYIDSQD